MTGAMQGSLFGAAQPVAARSLAPARTTAEPAIAGAPFNDAIPFGRGPAWRAPTRGDHVCDAPGCGSACGFGQGSRWYCRDHLPPGFLPARAVRP